MINKKKIIITLALMAILGAVAVFLFIKAKSWPSGNSITDCLELADKYQSDSCLMNIFYNYQNESACDNLSTDSLRTFCLDTVNSKKAQGQNNIDECGKISESRQKECYFTLIYKNGDPKLCDNIPEKFKEECANLLNDKLAVKNLDKSLCQKITTLPEREDCLYKVDSLQKNQK